MTSYMKLSIAVMLPVIAAIVLYLLDKKTAFGKIKRGVKQVIYGVIFGALAIVGTEWGIPMNGAQVNCRDAAVLIAGLLFGAPAGLIAGVIGAAERWIAVAWGIGTFTRVACTVSTLFAGIYSAALRKYMFEDRRPGWIISFAIGVVMEVFHVTMVFVTNMASPDAAMDVIRSCTIPMVTANGLSVFLAAVLVALLAGDISKEKKINGTRISQTIQRWLLVTVAFAFCISTFFVFKLQNKIADDQADSLLALAIDGTAQDIEDASNKNLLSITREIAKKTEYEDLNAIAEEYGVAEVNIFDFSGTVTDSSVRENIGANAADYEESAGFMCLTAGETEYVQGYRMNATPTDGEQNSIRKYAGVSTDSGFVQVGYDAEHLQAYIDNEVVDLTKNDHVGKTGFILIVNKNFEVISAPKTLSPGTLKDGLEEIIRHDAGTTVITSVNEEMCRASYCISEGYYIISVLPEEEALSARDVSLYVNVFLEIIIFAALFGLIYMLIKKVVVNRITDVNKSLAKITGGDLDEVVNVRTNREFASLSDDINATVDTLKRYIDEAAARIDAELEFAKSIQASALPNVFPAFPKRKDFDIYAIMNPAREVGGDFYDFYLTDNTLNVLVADVSGKGIPAAMFMMRAKTELKTLTEMDAPLSDVFTVGNNALCEGNDAGMFVTAWQGSVNLESGVLQYANAGHNPPLVRHADGNFEYLRSRAGFVLAGMEDFKYKTQELQLVPGDIIYLYTDGVTEATNACNELYGEERLLNAVNSREFENMEQLCRFVKSDVDEFVGEAPQFDDITMVALKYIGEPPVPSIHFEEAAIENIPAVTEFVETELEKLDFPMKSTMQVCVAIDEIFSNIVKYAYTGKRGPVTLKFIAKEEPRSIYLRFEDEGIPYNPLTNTDPDTSLTAEERSIGGLGIFVVKKTMDDMKYKYENGKNILTIKKLY